MTEPSTKGASTRVSRIIKPPRKAVYQAFLDRDAVASWLPTETMTDSPKPIAQRFKSVNSRLRNHWRDLMLPQSRGDKTPSELFLDTLRDWEDSIWLLVDCRSSRMDEELSVNPWGALRSNPEGPV